MPELNDLSYSIIGCAFRVHSYLGPGLLESIYEPCLVHELTLNGLQVAQQVPMPIVYKGKHVGSGYRADMVVENAIILELKAVETILPVHQAQLLTYMKLSGLHLGLLLNFHVADMKQGIRRFIL